MTHDELRKVLADPAAWLASTDPDSPGRADLQDVNLQYADLRFADLAQHYGAFRQRYILTMTDALVTSYYKVTYDDGTPCHGGTGRWHLPSGGRPGKRMPDVPVSPCRSGYHLCRVEDLRVWLMGAGTTVWLAEGFGDGVDHGDKVVFPSARLIGPVLSGAQCLLLAADFAAHVAHLNPDPRVAAAIQATRDYANGHIDAAARDASRDAAWAARDAAWAAGDAAWAAARAAAWAASRDATGAAAGAARAAAGAAAWAASRDASRDAAWAARAAAGDAERAWQTKRISEAIGHQESNLGVVAT